MESTVAQQNSKDNQQDFIVGDVVVYKKPHMTSELRTVVGVFGERVMIADQENRFSEGVNIRTATVAELNAKRRLTKVEQALAEVT
ncbi:hypothetical protein CDG60_08560 [Acinetobacter chinensis]|jgi:hypothetical protein|uniref:Uncharacterized protein n=1 Tax=Acinetobacter chinensis TaxID=2004650 RepID=A0A3B7LXB8_9GAMM|nr:hypothetical protein [Acinetobacter chinensis]AXY56614.1 hypothetical protein CDG60_08560 [Acinetobacter chinensis]